MESLPPVHWQNLATKEDLNTLSVVIGAEFTKVAAEFTAVRGEFAEQIGMMHKEIGRLHRQIAENSQKMSDKIDTMRRWVVGSVLALACAVVANGLWLG